MQLALFQVIVIVAIIIAFVPGVDLQRQSLFQVVIH